MDGDTHSRPWLEKDKGKENHMKVGGSLGIKLAFDGVQLAMARHRYYGLQNGKIGAFHYQNIDRAIPPVDSRLSFSIWRQEAFRAVYFYVLKRYWRWISHRSQQSKNPKLSSKTAFAVTSTGPRIAAHPAGRSRQQKREGGSPSVSTIITSAPQSKSAICAGFGRFVLAVQQKRHYRSCR
jgi:hypothetical protein